MEKNLDDLKNFYHPAFCFIQSPSFSLKNLKSPEHCANAAVGFLSAFSFLEKYDLNYFPEIAFGLDEKLLPKIEMVKFNHNGNNNEAIIKELITNIFFKEKDVSRGKTPKNLKETSLLIRNIQKRSDLSAEEFLIELLETLQKDKISISLPPLWSVGIKWRPPKNLVPEGKQFFSAGNSAHFHILKNWAALNSFDFLVASSELPYPYSSLEPILKYLLKEKELVTNFLKDNVGKGNEAVSEKLKQLFEEKGKKIAIWAKDVDSETEKIIKKIVERISSPFIVFSSREFKSPIEIEEIKLLFLLEEGEKWFKENQKYLGIEEEKILDYLEEKNSLQISPYEPLFFENFSKIENKSLPKKSTRKIQEYLIKAFTESDAFKKEKSIIRILIESGQVEVALEKIEKIKNQDDEVCFLKLWAKSQLKDFNYVLKERDKIKNINEEDFFSLSFFYAEALWLSGKFEEGEKELEKILKKCKNEKEKFRILSQLFLLNLNCGKSEKAGKILEEIKKYSPSEDFKENLLINHHIAALERSKNNEETALLFLENAVKSAKEGGYRLHETLLNIEIGNILRILGRYEDSLKYLKKAIFQSQVLRNKEAQKQAQFDIIITEVENGNLLQAQEDIVDLIESRSKKAPVAEVAIEKYWLSLILFLRGELIQALEMVDAPLKTEKNFLDKELYLSLSILRGNILYAMNDLKSFQLLIRKLNEEKILSAGADFILEYVALFYLAHQRKLLKISEEEKAIAERAFEKGSVSSKISYLLAKARCGEADSLELAQKAYEIAVKHNNILAEAQALLLLYKTNKLPILTDEKIEKIINFLRDNKIKSELSDLLKIGEKRRQNEGTKKENTISFLFKISNSRISNLNETITQFVKFSEVDGAMIVCLDGNDFAAGKISSKEKIRDILREKTEKRIDNYFVYSDMSKEGMWGAIACQNKIANEQKELFSVFLNLLNYDSSTETKEEEDYSLIDKIIVGDSQAVKELKKKILDASKFNFPVLITGEAGSGKEACAKSIHLCSSRARKEWVAFNCANLTPTLATSQLFGHRRGAFTGADSDKEGLVSAAKDSTLFLDEIGELPLETQAHFLRFLQDGSYQPLGSNITYHSNARIIAATNRNLEEEVRKGNFREDLYYRLKVITIEVPPLRARKEDIIPLFEKFLSEECEKEKVKKPLVKKGALFKLLSYEWYGNVRELQNFVKRAIVSSIKSGTIDEKQVVFEKNMGIGKMTLKQRMEDYEKKAIEEILKRNSYNLSQSAKEAGLSRHAFCQRAKKLGLIK